MTDAPNTDDPDTDDDYAADAPPVLLKMMLAQQTPKSQIFIEKT